MKADAPSPRLDDIIGYTDASLRCQVSLWTIRRAVARGEIRAYRLPGNRTGLHREDVRRWAARRHGNRSNHAPRDGGTP